LPIVRQKGFCVNALEINHDFSQKTDFTLRTAGIYCNSF
jgi:hypothetical protein